MKRNIKNISRIISAFVVAAAVLTGCSADEEATRKSVTGTTVRLAAGTSQYTKTVFGSDYGTDNKTSLYWTSDDKVYVSCAQAASGNVSYTSSSTTFTLTGVKQWAVYGTTSANGTTSTATFALPSDKTADTDGSYGLRWGTAKIGYAFYSFYPADFVTEPSDEAAPSTITVTIPATQDCTTPASATSSVYTATPDMQHDIMWGRLEGVSAGAETVTLKYKPIATVLDLTITNSSGSEHNGITAVSVTSDTYQLAGSFDFTAADGALAAASSNTAANNKTTQTAFSSSVSLSAGEKLNTRVFLPLPGGNTNDATTIDASDFTIKILYGTTYRAVKLASTAGTKLPAGKITKVNLTLNTGDKITISLTVSDWEDDADNSRVVS